MLRDLRQLSMLLMPLAVTGVFVFNFAEQPNLGREAPLLVVEILLVLLAPIALRLALAGFVAENRAFWITMAAPCDPGAILAGKFAFAYALSLALGGAATAALGAATHIHGLYALLTLGLLACAMASFCGIGVAASAMFADLSVENARFTVPAAGRMVIFGGQIAYTVVLGCVLGGAWALVRFAGLPTTPTYAGAGVLVPLVSAAFVLLPMAVAARKLRRMEW